MSPTFSPVSLGGIGKASISGTTGSPTIDTSSRPGKTIYGFTGSGTMTVDKEGYVELFILGGGGAGGGYSNSGSVAAGGGGGGAISHSEYFLKSGTYTVTVGAGGANSVGPGLPGFASGLVLSGQTILGALGGGPGVTDGVNQRNGTIGGCGGGAAIGSFTGTYFGGAAQLGQGFDGGTTNGQNNAGSATGGGGAGASPATTNGGVGNGGNGITVNINGSAVTYGGGGGGGSNNIGAGTGGTGFGGDGMPTVNSQRPNANSGGGGGGGLGGNFSRGGSGIVIVVTG